MLSCSGYPLHVSVVRPNSTLIGAIFGSDHEGDPFDFTLVDRDGGPFDIMPSGMLFVNTSRGSLNFEMLEEYVITVRIKETRNSRGPLLDSIANFTITVLDVKEAPFFHVVPTALSVVADSCPGTLVSMSPFPLQVSDEDYGNSSILAVSTVPANTTFDVVGADYGPCRGNMSCYFAVRADAGRIVFGANNNRITVSVSVVDDSNLSSLRTFNVSVTQANEPPTVSNESKYICENPPINNTMVFGEAMFAAGVPPTGFWSNTTGSPVNATVNSCPQNLTYSLQMLPSNLPVNQSVPAVFDIDPLTGIIFLRNGTLNFEVQSTYNVTVTVRHNMGVTVTNITIRVVNVDEPTTMTGPTQVTPNANLAVGTLVGSAYTVINEDFKELQLVVSGGNGYFAMVPNVSRNTNGTRSPVNLVVIRAGLPNDVFRLDIIAVNSIVPNNSFTYAVICIVRDINYPAALTTHITADTAMAAVLENPQTDVVAGIVNASDPNTYQNLTFSVTGDMSRYFYTVPIFTPTTFLDTTVFTWLRNNRQPILCRAAYLMVRGGSAIDYEAGAAFSFMYTPTIQVVDEPILQLSGQYVLSTEGDLPVTISGTVFVPVADRPDTPYITKLLTQSPFGLTTAGGEEVVIEGGNFGNIGSPHPSLDLEFASNNVLAYYDNNGTRFTAVSCAVSVSYVRITCRSASGFGSNYAWSVTIGRFLIGRNLGAFVQTSALSSVTTSYAPPSVSAFSAPEGSSENPSSAALTVGGQTILVRGSQFGTVLANRVASVTYGPSGIEYVARACNVTKDHEEITCITSAGVGSSLRWVVNIDGLLSVTPTTSYAIPEITDVRILNESDVNLPYDPSHPSVLAGTVGGQQIVIRGNNFGPVNEPLPQVDAVLYGPRVPVFSSMSGAISGYTLTTATSFTATGCTVVVDHVEVRCNTTAGVGKDLFWQIRVRGQDSVLSAVTTAYAPPFVHNVKSPSNTASGPTAGGVQIMINGGNFGRQGDSPVVFFGRSLTTQIARGSISPVTHEEVRFSLPPGHGASVPVRVVVGGQSSNVDSSFSYAEPVVASVAYVSGFQGSDISISVSGSNFGQCCYGKRMGNAAALAQFCECRSDWIEQVVVWQTGTYMPTCTIDSNFTAPLCSYTLCVIQNLTESTISCRLRALSGLIQVVVGGQYSNIKDYVYAQLLPAPIIKGIPFVYDQFTTGGSNVTLSGEKFGAFTGVVQFHFRNQSAPNAVSSSYIVPLQVSNWSDTAVSFVLPEGQGNPTLVMFIPGAENTTTVSFQGVKYGNPVIHSVANNNVSTSAGWSTGEPLLTIAGQNFGPNAPGDYNFVQIVSGYNDIATCAIVSWNHSMIRCMPPVGTGASNTIQVLVFRRDMTLAVTDSQYTVATTSLFRLSYLPPRLDVMYLNSTGNATGTHGPTGGGALVTILGSSLSVKPASSSTYNVVLRLAGTAITNIVTLNHSVLQFITPPGMGRNLPVSLEIDRQSSNTLLFSYDPPVIYRFEEVTGSRTAANNESDSCHFDATASIVRIVGTNFAASPIFVTFLSTVPGFPDERPLTTNLLGDSIIEMRLANMRVGPKAVNLTISLQTVVLPVSEARLVAECGSGYYGLPNSNKLCTPCPACSNCVEAASPSVCSGGFVEPVSAPGYWRSVSSTASLTASANATNLFDNSFNFTVCVPPTGCVGNNTCATGYQGTACSVCIPKKFHRDLLTGFCVPCPKAAVLQLIIIFVAVVIVAFIVYKLYQKGPSVAAIGIAIDYFQIMSIFGALQMDWPGPVMTVFRTASASASNADVTSPECSISVGYITKWYFFQALPIVVIILGVFINLIGVLYKYVCFPSRRKEAGYLTKHTHGLFGFVLLLLNFDYISLTKKGFEALDCTYVGFERVLSVDATVPCTGSTYETLRLWAYITIVGYGVGIPLLYSFIIFRAGGRMKVDQSLRMRGLSGSRETNPFYDMQKRFKRLYFKFRPEMYFWTLVIIMRKFSVVLVAAFIGKTPLFCATVIVLILFVAYALQVRWIGLTHFMLSKGICDFGVCVRLRLQAKFRPYRHHISGEAGTLTGNVVDLSKTASDSSPIKSQPGFTVPSVPIKGKQTEQEEADRTVAFTLHASADAMVAKAKAEALADERPPVLPGIGTFRTPKNRFTTTTLFQLLSFGKADNLAVRLETRKGGLAKVKTKYLQDYNLLESTFLTASIVILLCGIMFKAADLPKGSPQANALAYFVLIMCIGSAVVCALTIFVELSASFAYYGRAFQLRYRKKRKLRSEMEAKLRNRKPNAFERFCPCLVRLRKRRASVRNSTAGADFENSTSWAALTKEASAVSRRRSTDNMSDVTDSAVRAYMAETRSVTVGKGAGKSIQEKEIVSAPVGMPVEDLQRHRAQILEFTTSITDSKVGVVPAVVFVRSQRLLCYVCSCVRSFE